MPPIITFIGWHDSGKTTLATQVVSHLHQRGYRVAVIKSSKDQGISFDSQGTDTFKHRLAGAEGVLFVAPDQLVMQSKGSQQSLSELAHRYFPHVDIVIGEGFKEDPDVDKIEVFRGPDTKPLRREVPRVVAVATDTEITASILFRLDEGQEIASFIVERYLQAVPIEPDHVSLKVNGEKIPLNQLFQNSLAGTVAGLLDCLSLQEKTREIELRITLD